MALPLLRILERITNENLKGPTISFTTHKKTINDHDLDNTDPRWIDLLKEYFIDSVDDYLDDILFFVRHKSVLSSSTSSLLDQISPIFVQRRSHGLNMLKGFSKLIIEIFVIGSKLFILI
jgi:hypothetical protein